MPQCLLFFKGAIFNDFRFHFGIALACCFACFRSGFLNRFLDAFWEAEKPNASPNGVILGPPGRARGGVNPPLRTKIAEL